MALPTRPLGSSGLDITTVGFGAWAVGGGGWLYGWGAQEDDESVVAIHRALELGINWIDTAAAYGHGHSEEVVGRALADLPEADRPLVFTKCGLPPHPSGDPMAENPKDLRPEMIRSECEGSLRRLGVERIDLFQFHWPDDTGTAVEDSWATMLDLVAEGKVRVGGVSNFPPELLDRCEALGHVGSLQPPFSLINRSAGADVIPWCAKHETGVIVYSPMQSGLLTDRFNARRIERMDKGDWRRTDPDFIEPDLSANLALRDALAPVAARHETTIAAVAVAWTLSWTGVSGAIVGARSADQVEGWIGAASLSLTADDLDEIAAAIVRTGAGAGPPRP